MIDEPTEERACLFVLGLLPADEATAFESLLSKDSELRTLVASLNNATLALAESAPQITAPVELLARLQRSLAQRKVVPFPVKSWRVLPWAAALAMLGLFIHERREHQSLLAISEQSLMSMEQKMQVSTEAVQDLQAKQTQLQQERTAANTKAEALQKELATATTQLTSTEQDCLALQAKLTSLTAAQQLDKARLAVLGSLLKDVPKAVAVSLWNQDTQDGLLVVENLPALKPSKDYQLWIIDPDIPAPVSAGIFKVDAAGKGRLIFKPTQAIKTAGKFAITEEIAGGAAAPTMKSMVVIGG